MATPLGSGLMLDAEIRHAEVALQQSTHRLRNHLARGRVQTGAKLQSLKPKVMVGVAAAAAGWLLIGARRPRVVAPPRTSTRAAAVVAPLALRLLTPTLGRELASLVATVAVPLAFTKGPPPPQTAPTVRLQSYAGRWFELARLSNPFEAVCDHNVTATYVPQRDGRFDVINRCETRRGRLRQAQGVARVVPGSANAKLKVSFAPRALRWLPFAWADYWILDVTPDYSAALVGTPGRNALWLLGRSPTIEQSTLERLLARAGALGYDIAALKFTPQTGREPGIARP
jgi:apolipoprotein D and lipocalin family protein